MLPQNSADLDQCRKLFMSFATDKSAPKALLAQLKGMPKTALTQAYAGMAQAVMAKSIFNPLLKLSRFFSAAKKIDNAILMEPDAIEIRFIRYVLQKNTPTYVGYNQYLGEDTKKLIALLAAGTDTGNPWLLPIIEEISDDGTLDNAQLTELKKIRERLDQHDGASSLGQ